MATDELYKELVAGALEDNRMTARISFLLGGVRDTQLGLRCRGSSRSDMFPCRRTISPR